MDDKESSLLQYLVLSGALEAAGISDSGEPLYNFTPKLKEIMPELYDIHQNNMNHQVIRLWEMGFVNLDLFEESPLVTLTEKAFDSDAISSLSEDDRFSINEIKRVILG